jgi:cytochrome c553
MLTFWSALATAQTPGWTDLTEELQQAMKVKGDPARGAAEFEPCIGCHREDASGRTSGAYPRLAGQHASVLMKQITDIRAGRRANPKMEPFIDDHVLSPYQIADLGAYLQGLPVSDANGKGPGKAIQRGRQLYERDCTVCHGERGEGDGPRFYPELAAQHYRYLLREEYFIRDGDRHNANPEMVRVIKPYAAADLEAVADYLAQLPPPGSPAP